MKNQGNFTKKALYFSVLLVLGACGSEKKGSHPISFQRLKTFPVELLSEEIQFGEKNLPSKTLRKENPSFIIRRSIEIPFLRFEPLKAGDHFPVMEGARTLAHPGQPHVPYLTYRFQLKPGARPHLKLINPLMEESTQGVGLSKTSPLFIWGKGRGFFESSISNQQESELSKKYYPGKMIHTFQDKDTLVVNLFPVQVERQTGKVLKLISVEWGMEARAGDKVQRGHEGDSTEGLIITSKTLWESAKALQAFHQNHLNKRTEIITVEEISDSEIPVPNEELPDGYTSPEWFEGSILSKKESSDGYDFELAKKIISFLRKRAKTSEHLKYVTLLGNSQIIPPSYYFKRKGTAEISRAGVTDQCYAAGEMCLEANLAVGRLPFKSNEEVAAYLKKAQRWLIQNRESKSDLALFGGKAFSGSPFYIGELGALEVISSLNFGWRNIQKFFQTERNFNKTSQEEMFSGRSHSSLVYYLDHGLGNRLFSGEESVSSKDILEMKASQDFAPPVVVSVSCINAAFDEELLLDETIEEKERFGSVSIGTALLKSEQGAIAYLGGTREGLGSPDTLVDLHGNVKVVGTSYGLQMLEGFIRQHQFQEKTTLGDALKQALNAYAHENGNNMDEFFHRYTFWITELLGDPVMPLPFVQGGEETLPQALSRFQGLKKELGIPELPLDRSEEGANLSLKVFSEQTAFSAKIFKIRRERRSYSGESLVKEVVIDSAGETDLTSKIKTEIDEPGHYLVKLVNLKGVPKEQHVVFRASKLKK